MMHYLTEKGARVPIPKDTYMTLENEVDNVPDIYKLILLIHYDTFAENPFYLKYLDQLYDITEKDGNTFKNNIYYLYKYYTLLKSLGYNIKKILIQYIFICYVMSFVLH